MLSMELFPFPQWYDPPLFMRHLPLFQAPEYYDEIQSHIQAQSLAADQQSKQAPASPNDIWWEQGSRNACSRQFQSPLVGHLCQATIISLNALHSQSTLLSLHIAVTPTVKISRRPHDRLYPLHHVDLSLHRMILLSGGPLSDSREEEEKTRNIFPLHSDIPHSKNLICVCAS